MSDDPTVIRHRLERLAAEEHACPTWLRQILRLAAARPDDARRIMDPLPAANKP